MATRDQVSRRTTDTIVAISRVSDRLHAAAQTANQR